MEKGPLSGGRTTDPILGLLVGIAIAVPLVVAFHWGQQGWRDRHENYPSRPNGYTQIVNRFGQACSGDARAISMSWRAADTGTTYRFPFHRKLGGRPTQMVSRQGRAGRRTWTTTSTGTSSNSTCSSYVEHGIYGYACRAKRGGSEWSTHAFGIAIDVSSAEDYMGKCSSTVNRHHAPIWQSHGWYWGLAFCDPMHFQFATGY